MWPTEAWKRAPAAGHASDKSLRRCTPFKLPSLGLIEISPGHTIKLESDAVFVPQCDTWEQSQFGGGEGGGVTSIADMQDPFHASITPQAYATGAATVIAWMLVIMLIITPRTFFVGGASGRSGLMGRRGMISGASGGGSIIGVGTRPWLQKVAALTVAVSLTLATADTFKIAERQYEEGFMDAMKLRDQVVSGMEIKVSRVISDVFLWLAQVQTLIRLFPRHKEKVIIKWVGFALILLDITFSSLNSFGPYNDKRSPRHFETAIPALSYLFQLSLSMLYAAWVMYYAITKRRYAFYHSMMWNITIVALLSIVAILTPVVFFITDISNYTIAGWGDYFRWVGAAAASVIVWEWVERIEALEREERKDGILGREIYDGDEMLDTTPSSEFKWPGSQRQSWNMDDEKKGGGGGGEGGGLANVSSLTSHLSNLAQRLGRSKRDAPDTQARKKRTIHVPAPAPVRCRSGSGERGGRSSRNYQPLQSPPAVPVISSPVSRTDTTSADSTVYTVRYHPISETPPATRQPATIDDRLQRGNDHNHSAPQESNDQTENVDVEKGVEVTEDLRMSQTRGRWHWQAVANPFRRRHRSPPPEVQRGRVIEPFVVDKVPTGVTVGIPQRNYTGIALKDRLGTFAAQQGDRFRSKKGAGPQSETSLPVTIIPAQPRGRTWSPEILNQQQSQQETSTAAGVQIDSSVSDAIGNDAEASHPQTNANNDSRESVPESSASTTNRTSHIRFAPETLQPQDPPVRTGAESNAPSLPLSTAALGNEVPSLTDTSSQPQDGESILISRPQTPTNHDR